MKHLPAQPAPKDFSSFLDEMMQALETGEYFDVAGSGDAARSAIAILEAAISLASTETPLGTSRDTTPLVPRAYLEYRDDDVGLITTSVAAEPLRGMSPEPLLSVASLERARRLLALHAHPDLAAPGRQQAASDRMSELNALVDEAIKRARRGPAAA